MNILKKIIILSPPVLTVHLADAQEMVNVFELFKEKWLLPEFSGELERGDFRAVWGQSLDELVVEIGKLNLLYYV